MSKSIELSLSEATCYLRVALETENEKLGGAISDAVLGHWLMDGISGSSFLPDAAESVWPHVAMKFEQMICPAPKHPGRIKEKQGLLDFDWKVKLDSVPELTCIDLFAGCGGLSLGLEEAGFTPLLFSEINKDAAATYLANRSASGYFQYADISDLTDAKITRHLGFWRENGIPEIDLVCGGPPCQGYSGIGLGGVWNGEQ